MKASYFSLLLIFFALLSLSAEAQPDLGFSMMRTVPQQISTNPSSIPLQGGYAGLPVISGFAVHTAFPFAYRDLFRTDEYDSLEFQPEKFLDRISKDNFIQINSKVDLLSVGFIVADPSYFLHFSIKSRVAQQSRLPDDLFYLLWYGNHAPEIFGKTINLAPRIDLVAFDEYAVGFSGKALGNKLSYGATVKYLAGRFNISTVKSSLDFYTHPETFDIYGRSDIEIRTSGVDGIDQYFDHPVHRLINPGNHGFGVDLGVTYQIDPGFSVFTSLLDLGTIRWKRDNLTLVSREPGAEFIFRGLNLRDFVALFESPELFAKRVEDSLRALARIDSLYDVPYSASLPWRIHAGGSWQFNQNSRLNLVIGGTGWNRTFRPEISVSYNLMVRRFFELLFSYNIYNNKFTNVGAGFSLSAGPVQIYAVSDNLAGIVFPRQASSLSFRAGLNILINRNRVAPAISVKEKVIAE